MIVRVLLNHICVSAGRLYPLISPGSQWTSLTLLNYALWSEILLFGCASLLQLKIEKVIQDAPGGSRFCWLFPTAACRNDLETEYLTFQIMTSAEGQQTFSQSCPDDVKQYSCLACAPFNSCVSPGSEEHVYNCARSSTVFVYSPDMISRFERSSISCQRIRCADFFEDTETRADVRGG